MQVQLPGWYRRCDNELARAIANVLHWDSEIPDDRVGARVRSASPSRHTMAP